MSHPDNHHDSPTHEQEVWMDTDHDGGEQDEATRAVYIPRTETDADTAEAVRAQIPAPRHEDDTIEDHDRPASADPSVEAIEGEIVDADHDGAPDRFAPGDPTRSRPVDPADAEDDRPLTTVLRERFEARPDVLPGWAKSARQFRDNTTFLSRYAAHASGYHAARTPLYAGRLARRSPRGLKRVAVASARWVFDAEAAPVRQHAARNLEMHTYRQLRLDRKETVRKRLIVAAIAAVGLLVIGLLLGFAAPWWMQWAALLATIGGLGLAGAKPDSEPVIGRAVVNHGVAKLTSDIVVRALGGVGLSGINQALAPKGQGITFPAPITRDGPGWRATVDLPHGVTAGEVIERRQKLASGLRRPLGCVWPEGDRDTHEGRLVLWVGDKDMNKSRQRYCQDLWMKIF